ncbi:MAG: PQQ-like beta-propeller repeat protein, partial [Pirellulaceae bacterium]|nr:PQQ-like beta-propeller repeat protein [Pirellulaceae bacterium]
MKSKFVITLAWLLTSLSALQAVEPSKDAWPQWGGIHRDHKSQATGLMQEWPEGGPKLVWTANTAGMGYSSMAVTEGRLYSLGTQDNKNFAYCLDATTGKDIWRVEIGAAMAPEAYNMGWGGGPRSTPTVLDDRVIVLDDAGNCCSLDKQTGKVQWKVNLISDLGGSMPKWGFSESPLVDGDRVVVCPGGSNFLVALDVKTGAPVMKSSGYAESPHYVSVIKHNVDGVDCYTTASGKGLVSFSAKDGTVLWTNASTGASIATIPTPIVRGNQLYHTAGY